MFFSKQTLRQQVFSCWQRLSQSQIQLYNKQAVEFISSLDLFLQASDVLAYYPIKTQELDFIFNLCKIFKKKTIFSPN